MKKISTLISFDVESAPANVGEKIEMQDEMSPKVDTLKKLRAFARAAFSDTALTGLPLIILN